MIIKSIKEKYKSYELRVDNDVDIRTECGEVLGVQCQARDCEECEEGLALMELYKGLKK